MPCTEVTIPTPDGTASATLHTPDGAGPWPGVIVYFDAAGIREAFQQMADRLAGLGYAVLLPDLYYRAGEYAPFDMKTLFSTPSERDRFRAFSSQLTADAIAGDTGAYLDFLAGRPEVAAGGVGVVGYCMGGRLAMIVAAAHPDRIAAAASFHGGRLADEADPDSPHRTVDKIHATVLVAAAQDDHSFPAEQFERLEQALTAAGVSHTIDTYAAAHGFAVPDNRSYDEAAAERHWVELADLYARALGG
ncbi:dienelactone hydrolase family protein [Tsukamurella soli]|uniref:Dienelactone hydrolase family protein n=1 Tax=Tsukamurella soli TaxID=644556 RepID=A0ABP8J7J2_9ACTN